MSSDRPKRERMSLEELAISNMWELAELSWWLCAIDSPKHAAYGSPFLAN